MSALLSDLLTVDFLMFELLMHLRHARFVASAATLSVSE